MNSEFQSYLGVVSTRELAAIIWLFVLVFFLLTKEFGRKAISLLLQAFFQKKY